MGNLFGEIIRIVSLSYIILVGLDQFFHISIYDIKFFVERNASNSTFIEDILRALRLGLYRLAI